MITSTFLSTYNVLATVNTMIHNVDIISQIRKTRQGSPVALPKPQLVGGRVRIQAQVCLFIKLYHCNFFPLTVIGSLKAGVGKNLGIIYLDFAHGLGETCIGSM
jgi:hypothetical protein